MYEPPSWTVQVGKPSPSDRIDNAPLTSDIGYRISDENGQFDQDVHR